MFRFELRNRKARTEKMMADHRREIAEVHEKYRSLCNEKDESLERLRQSRDKEGSEFLPHAEKAQPGQVAKITSEESLGQEMDALQSEIKRIADAYAKVLAKDKGPTQHVRRRLGGTRNRFFLVKLALVVGSLVSKKFEDKLVPSWRITAEIRQLILPPMPSLSF